MMGREKLPPVAVDARTALPRTRPSNYPEPFASWTAGRIKRPLGDLFGLRNFGVVLPPSRISALRHAHSKQDEFIYILQGTLTLITDRGETQLAPGMCAGFAAGTGDAHQLVNRTIEPVTLLEVGDRSADDVVVYPHDDLQACLEDGRWTFRHKDGTTY